MASGPLWIIGLCSDPISQPADRPRLQRVLNYILRRLSGDLEATGQVRFSPPRSFPKVWEHAYDFRRTLASSSGPGCSTFLVPANTGSRTSNHTCPVHGAITSGITPTTSSTPGPTSSSEILAAPPPAGQPTLYPAGFLTRADLDCDPPSFLLLQTLLAQMVGEERLCTFREFGFEDKDKTEFCCRFERGLLTAAGTFPKNARVAGVGGGQGKIPLYWRGPCSARCLRAPGIQAQTLASSIDCIQNQ